MRRRRRFSPAGYAAVIALAVGLAGSVQAQLVVGPFVAPSSFYLVPRDGAIVLTWSAVLNPALVGYNVYRRETGRTADTNVLMNATPLLTTSAVDAGADNKGLKNGTAYVYSVKGVFLGSDGKAVEGPATRDIAATAQPPIRGFLVLYDIETLNPGSATLDASNLLTIQGSGAGVSDTVDALSFAAVPVANDFQVTIKLNERPSKATTGTSDFGNVGLQIRTDLAPRSAYASLFAAVTRNPEHLFEGRGTVNGAGANRSFSVGSGIDSAAATFPVWLRLVRRGAVIQAFISTNGTTFQQVGTNQDFGTLPANLQVGVAATAGSDGNYVLGKLDYSTLKIENPS